MERLNERLGQLVATSSYQTAASSVGQLIRRENGVDEAVTVLEDIHRSDCKAVLISARPCIAVCRRDTCGVAEQVRVPLEWWLVCREVWSA